MQLGWIDFSKADREKALEVMNLLRTPGAVDEIGIGQIRDAFANLFFPGTSTIQTRAKYFLIVPYVLQEAIEGKYGDDVQKVLRAIDNNEFECGRILKKNEPSAEGIIGIRVLPEKWVARPPSEIYWSGLRTFNILNHDSLSMAEMVRLSIAFRNKKEQTKLGNKKTEKTEDWDDEDAGLESTFHFINLPDSFSSDWREGLSINLTYDEAKFLRNKIEMNAPGTLFEYILKNNVDVTKYDSFQALYEDLRDKLPEVIREKMQLACDFSRLVYAISARYNYRIALGRNTDHEKEWEWIYSNIDHFASVNLNNIQHLFPYIRADLKIFLSNMKAAYLKGELDVADELILKREIRLKSKTRSKLCHIEDQEADKWVGSRELDFRYNSAKTIIKDIYRGEGALNV